MNCKQAEKRILKSLDGRLDGRAADFLGRHLEACPSCRKTAAEYRKMLDLLRNGRDAAPQPGFWERLQPRLREEREAAPFLFWERWNLRAIPVFLALVAVAAAALFFTPQPGELNASEALLFENRNPLTETQAIFEAERAEDRNMRLIFASLEEKAPVRRPSP